MARKVIVFALLLIAMVGLASAASAPEPANATNSSSNPKEEAAAAPATDDGDGDVIGTTDDDHNASSPDVAVAGPLGTGSTYESATPTSSPSSGATAVHISYCIAGAAALAGSSFF